MTKQLYFEDVHEGVALPVLEKFPTTKQLVKYAGASADYYQIHYDQEFARDNGLPNVIMHGALKNAFLGQIMTDWMGEYGTLKKLSARYHDIDIPGLPVYVKGRVRRTYTQDQENLVECEVWMENHRGKKTTSGYAVVTLPSRYDQRENSDSRPGGSSIKRKRG